VFLSLTGLSLREGEVTPEFWDRLAFSRWHAKRTATLHVFPSSMQDPALGRYGIFALPCFAAACMLLSRLCGACFGWLIFDFCGTL